MLADSSCGCVWFQRLATIGSTVFFGVVVQLGNLRDAIVAWCIDRPIRWTVSWNVMTLCLPMQNTKYICLLLSKQNNKTVHGTPLCFHGQTNCKTRSSWALQGSAFFRLELALAIVGHTSIAWLHMPMKNKKNLANMSRLIGGTTNKTCSGKRNTAQGPRLSWWGGESSHGVSLIQRIVIPSRQSKWRLCCVPQASSRLSVSGNYWVWWNFMYVTVSSHFLCGVNSVSWALFQKLRGKILCESKCENCDHCDVLENAQFVCMCDNKVGLRCRMKRETIRSLDGGHGIISKYLFKSLTRPHLWDN